MTSWTMHCPGSSGPTRPGRSALFAARPWTAFTVLLLSGCGGEPPGASVGAGTGEVEVWRLVEPPLVEIGVQEGEEPYQLHRAAGSVRLADGRIVVLNAGSRELRFYGPEGTHQRSVGREGEGPGEFRFPTRLRKVSEDTLLVWDQGLQRISLFDTSGVFLGGRLLEPGPENLFPGDEWLLGWNWIDSPLEPGGRDVVRAAVEALPPPDTSLPLRFLRVTPRGRIWVMQRRPPSDSALAVEVYGLDGRHLARVELPPRFELHEIGEDYVLGRYRDELDVNYVRLYALEKPPGSPAGPGLPRGVVGTSAPERPPRPARPEELMAVLRTTVKFLAAAQEMYYAGNYTYVADVGALDETLRRFGGVPDEVRVDILFATSEGWMGTVTHRETGDMCALVYGSYVPMGWPPGSVICP